jgi:spore coat protein A
MGGSGHDRRQFIALGAKSALALGVASALPGSVVRSLVAAADPAVTGLSDPFLQPLFTEVVPNALDPGFKYSPTRGGRFYQVGVSSVPDHQTGLLQGGKTVDTEVFAYGQPGGPATWPGMTFEIPANTNVNIEWQNNLPVGGEDARPPIWTNAEDGFVRNVVDTSLHWCYSLPGYEGYTIDQNGVPIVVHVHGGHNRPLRDGNPEYFFSPDYGVKGPRWSGPVFQYPNDQPAGNLWYHDHALGITRLNVYAGMAGFYFLRDDYDTGLADNPAGLPAGDYELAYAIQDRMFVEDGRLFYPSYPGDPFYADFITDDVTLPPALFPDGGPTALAEFFGDHMVVNGKIWPKADVEPTQYRIHLLNGCDSRFLAVQLFEVPGNATDLSAVVKQLPFDVIGSDQGLATSTTSVETLLMETGSRYDLIVDFSAVASGNRVIMKNIGGDAPFGGDIPGETVFGETDRIMAFDVNGTASSKPISVGVPSTVGVPTRTRKVALFEGEDNFGRLQPLLGTAEPATDAQGKPINWPDTKPYIDEGLIGQMEGSIAWHSPTTENPKMNSTEEWEIFNVTGDAHPVHLHLVHYEILGRQQINYNTATEGAANGIVVEDQKVIQHDGEVGKGFRIVQPPDPADAYGAVVPLGPDDGYVENAPKDMVTALPGQITTIRVTFDRSGRYVWHCHILSHEDHEMMRVLEVGAIRGRPDGRH